MSEKVSARIALMDKQIIDRDRLPIGRVDDLEFDVPRDGSRPQVKAVLTGSQVLGDRIGGTLGRWMSAVSKQLRNGSAPTAIDPALIEDVEPLVRLRVALHDLPDVAALEGWLATHVIEKLPGSGDADK